MLNSNLNICKESNKALDVFKIPKPVKKKVKVLSEEQYIDEISKIIQRDFFPDLEKLQAQNDYLDALEKNDVIKLREIFAKYSGRRPNLRNLNCSPATFDTPAAIRLNTPYNKTSERNEFSPIIQENTTTSTSQQSLNSFLCHNTSEDNNSFQEIIEAAEKKLKQKFSELYSQETNYAENLSKALTLPSIEKQFAEIEGMKKIETWTYKNKNYIMYIPDGVDLTKEEKLDMINRKQQVSYHNTRLSQNPFNEYNDKETITKRAQFQSKSIAEKVGVDGKILEKNLPQFRSFDFVKTPSPCPGESCSPLMTWGQIEGTPFRLDGGDTPIRHSVGPSFHINQTPRRESIALQLAEKAGERMRAQKQKAKDTAKRNISSPYIRTSMERLASISPAAKKLATIKLGLRTYTPTPSPHRKQTSINLKLSSPVVQKRTPIITNNSEIMNNSIIQQNITDNLLNIPSKRQKASDFF